MSHERIYKHIWQDKALYGALYKHLRIGGTKQRRKRRNSRDCRGTIKNRIGIENRPQVVERKISIGDWEGRGSEVMIQVDPETGVLSGAADPRRDGYAIGW